MPLMAAVVKYFPDFVAAVAKGHSKRGAACGRRTTHQQTQHKQLKDMGLQMCRESVAAISPPFRHLGRDKTGRIRDWLDSRALSSAPPPWRALLLRIDLRQTRHCRSSQLLLCATSAATITAGDGRPTAPTDRPAKAARRTTQPAADRWDRHRRSPPSAWSRVTAPPRSRSSVRPPTPTTKRASQGSQKRRLNSHKGFSSSALGRVTQKSGNCSIR
jgi:hypothetical protein